MKRNGESKKYWNNIFIQRIVNDKDFAQELAKYLNQKKE